MQRKFILNIIFLISINLLIKPFWLLGVERYIQNAVGVETYGLYYALFGFSYILSIVLDFGIASYSNRVIARHEHMLPKYFSAIVSIKLLLAVVYTLLTLGLGWLVGYPPYAMYLLLLLILNQILSSFILYLRSNIAGMYLFVLDSFMSVLDKLLMILLFSLIYFFYPSAIRIDYFIIIQTIAYLCTALVALIAIYVRQRKIRLVWNVKVALLIARECAPYALLAVLMAFYFKIDTVLLERIHPDGKMQAGYYAAAYRLIDAGTMIAFLFSGILLPMFSRLLVQDRTQLASLIKTSFSFLLVPVSAFTILGFFYAKDWMALLYPADVALHCTEIFSTLCLVLLFSASTYIFGTLLAAANEIGTLNRIAGMAIVISAVFNCCLIPIMGAEGAAIAAALSFGLVGVLNARACFLKYPIRLGWKYVNAYLAFLLIVAACGSLHLFLSVDWKCLLGITFVVLLLSASALKLLPISKAFELLRSRSNS